MNHSYKFDYFHEKIKIIANKNNKCAIICLFLLLYKFILMTGNMIVLIYMKVILKTVTRI